MLLLLLLLLLVQSPVSCGTFPPSTPQPPFAMQHFRWWQCTIKSGYRGGGRACYEFMRLSLFLVNFALLLRFLPASVFWPPHTPSPPSPPVMPSPSIRFLFKCTPEKKFCLHFPFVARRILPAFCLAAVLGNKFFPFFCSASVCGCGPRPPPLYAHVALDCNILCWSLSAYKVFKL